MSAYTCLTAPGVEFETKDAFTAHYKSEWHRYNLKRKTAQLPMVSEAEFEARKAAAKQAAPAPKQDSHIRADKRDARRLRQEKKRRDKKGMSAVSGSTTLDAVAGYRNRAAVPDVPRAPEAEAEEDEPEAEAVEEVTAEARATDSFFDGRRFDTSADALEYMRSAYGFRVPEPAYLKDPDGLAEYLCTKVKVGRTCLWCQRQFRSYRACQQHMIDKAHCKVAYWTDAEVDELADFYDFSATWEGMDEGDARLLAPDDESWADVADDEDGWETASTDASESEEPADETPAPLAKRATRAKVLATGELQLRRGGAKKVVGARWLRTYYRQNFRLEDEREAVVAVRNESRARLLAAYERAGLKVSEGGFFARGLVAQYNRRTVGKQMRREQHMQKRNEMLTMGFRSGGKAKDFKSNKLIKHAVAGKNRGEGLGVHG
mmetsp:Transcript_15391/g.45984  ORF Transcript_15391/g.45984 Transcript_15391/m.45984 type:complete len:433 (+) Transcript_15391:214-1512(+)